MNGILFLANFLSFIYSLNLYFNSRNQNLNENGWNLVRKGKGHRNGESNNHPLTKIFL